MLAAAIRAASTPVIHQQVVRHLDYLTGLENIPRTGPVVIVANHSSYADHFMTLTLLHALRPGQVWYPTKAEAFETFGSRVWHESMNCFSVQRDAPSDAIFIKAKEVLDAGNILVLYPEGTRGAGRSTIAVQVRRIPHGAGQWRPCRADRNVEPAQGAAQGQ